jgi:hypothetical protein
MHIYWHIQYLDSADKEFKGRWLFADTEKLPAQIRYKLELLAEVSGGATK